MKQLFDTYLFRGTDKSANNRIALAPMTNKQSNDNGTLGEDEYRWLTRRAREGFGIVFTCAVHVQPDGKGWEGELGNYDDIHIPGLTRLASGIHQYGSLAIMQLFHGGARSPENLIHTQPWSASEHIFTIKNHNIPVRAATEKDITKVIQSFTKAAIRAYHAGFDGVELHGAHGYLLHQFLSTATNHRTDQWGGSVQNRARLITEILQSIRLHLPPYFLVGVRLSPEDKYNYKGIDIDDSLRIAEILKDNGADFIDISTWGSTNPPQKYPESTKPIITWFREYLGNEIPLFVAGEIWTHQDAVNALIAGADFVALGKAAIGIPDWPTLAKTKTPHITKPPYSTAQLSNADVGNVFIEYMRRWDNFVSDGDI